MAFYDWEYFNSANVVVEVEGMPILECVGLEVEVNESKRPIYGYSSRHFDAVSSGQVLVTGRILINYVDQNYFFRAIEKGLSDSGQMRIGAPPPLAAVGNDLRQTLMDEGNAQALLAQYALDPASNSAVPKILADAFYSSNTPPGKQIVYNPFDMYGGVDIKVTFGDREAYNFFGGLTHFNIEHVIFTGRSLPISLSENVIVEAHSFFARNISNRVNTDQLVQVATNSEQNISIQ